MTWKAVNIKAGMPADRVYTQKGDIRIGPNREEAEDWIRRNLVDRQRTPETAIGKDKERRLVLRPEPEFWVARWDSTPKTNEFGEVSP